MQRLCVQALRCQGPPRAPCAPLPPPQSATIKCVGISAIATSHPAESCDLAGARTHTHTQLTGFTGAGGQSRAKTLGEAGHTAALM